MATMTEQMKDKGKEIGAQVSNQVGKSVEGIRDAAGNVIEQVKDAGTNAYSAVEGKAEELSGSLSSGLKATARSIREHGPQEGTLGAATSAVAQTFSNSANFLDNQGLKGVCSDVTSLISRNPIPAFLMSVGIGFLLASSSRRS
ncbi:hypothetical protein [Schlesneria sp. DSM 10557]|uniref:hypothetical protein n=1 Tax=Schlesneria sp. DSM 10557 TaxID=3044399 RepID=UPI0035A16DDE